MKINERIVVGHPLGLNLRAGASLVSLANRFRCKVILRRGASQAEARSLLGLMTLGAVKGTELEIELEGEDAGVGWDLIRSFFENGFREKPSNPIRPVALNNGLT